MRVVREELSADDLYKIMKYSEGSILRQYERAFRAYGIEISFEDEALLLIANAAALEKTGARGLLTVWEKLFRDYKYHLAGSGLTQLRVTEEVVREPQRVLERLMAEGLMRPAGLDPDGQAISGTTKPFRGAQCRASI